MFLTITMISFRTRAVVATWCVGANMRAISIACISTLVDICAQKVYINENIIKASKRFNNEKKNENYAKMNTSVYEVFWIPAPQMLFIILNLENNLLRSQYLFYEEDSQVSYKEIALSTICVCGVCFYE